MNRRRFSAFELETAFVVGLVLGCLIGGVLIYSILTN